jgi:PLD-like domain
VEATVLKFIEGDELVSEFHAVASLDGSEIAVAFWGKGAAAELKLTTSNCSRIICNLQSGACDPDEVQKMKKLGFNLRTHPRLHAKVYLAKRAVIIGSANASANGLAMSEGFSSLREANIITDESTVLNDARMWFDKIWKEAHNITDLDIKEARRLWKKVPKTPIGGSLFEAFAKNDRELFDSVYIIVIFEEALDPGAKKQVKKIESQYPRFKRNTLWWQPTTPLKPDSLFIRCYLGKKEREISGYARVPELVISRATGRKNEYPVYPVVRESSLTIGTRSYKLTSDEKAVLLKNVQRHPSVLKAKGHDVVIPLRDIMPEPK